MLLCLFHKFTDAKQLPLEGRCGREKDAEVIGVQCCKAAPYSRAFYTASYMNFVEGLNSKICNSLPLEFGGNVEVRN